MGINSSKHKRANSQELSFRSESRMFLSLYKTSIQLLPETTPLSPKTLKIKEKSSLFSNINSKQIEEMGLELYSEMISKNNKINEAMYHPITVVKLNNNKDAIDFTKYQNESLNDWLTNFEMSNKIKLNEIEEHVSSIKTNSVDSMLKQNKSNNDKIYPQIRLDKSSNDIKVKNDDQLTMTSLLNQMSMKGSLNKSGYKSTKYYRQPSQKSINISQRIKAKSEVNVGANISELNSRESHRSNISPLKTVKNLLLNISSSKNHSTKSIKKNPTITVTKNDIISKSKTNPKVLKKLNCNLMSNSDVKFNHFVNKAMSKIPLLTKEDAFQIKTTPNFEGKNNAQRSKYDFHIEIVERTNSDKEQTMSSNNHSKTQFCKRYFKLNKEIEEEQIISKYFKHKPKKNYKIHIDLRKIPDEVIEINDSSCISNEHI